ncbi:MAG: IS5 family transposase [Patescibacteria group bacterium]|nr:MAG: IS5 family transposase [Patescibacteria group bacterium]
MVAVDGNGIPLAIVTEAANVSEYKLALKTVDEISVAKRPNHPKKRPENIVGDRGYDAKWLRKSMRQRRMKPFIPKRRKKGQKEEPRYNKRVKDMYKTRWIVERTNAWLQNYRRVAIRWDKLADSYEAFIELGCILICLRRV